MNKYKFDEHGQITPYQVHRCCIDTLEECFVRKPMFKKTTRLEIWKYYKDYNSILKSRISEPFKEICFGSFVSTKLNPTDIDVVIMIPHTESHKVMDLQGEHIFDEYSVDAAFVPLYEKGHKHEIVSKMLLDKKIKFGLFDDRTKKRRSMIEVKIV